MPRRPNTCPILIYWLFDIRTGIPFYCGKTTKNPNRRLGQHRYTAVKFPKRQISKIISECGDNANISVIETVPPGGDWVERERCRIAELRCVNPDCANTSAGGTGPTGLVMSEEARAKISLGNRGKRNSSEAIERMRLALTGRKQSPETIAKRVAKVTGKRRTAEFCIKNSLKQKGCKFTESHREALRLAQQRRRAREKSQLCPLTYTRIDVC